MLDRTRWVEGEGLLDLSKPSLQALSHILRHKDLWPDGFEWNFADCHHCAMGIAYELWDSIQAPYTRFMTPLNIDRDAAHDIFVCPEKAENMIITPEHIANLIDKYLDAKTS